MGTVVTKYRDIPWREVKKCMRVAPPENAKIWDKIRGTAISIEVPASGDPAGEIICAGPFFWIAPDARIKEAHRFLVCPHIAEIGD